MLRYLRASGKHTKAIWWLLTIVTVVTFLFGFNFIFGFGGDLGGARKGVRGVVNGSPITDQEFQAALTSQREAFRRQYGSDPADLDEKSVEAQAWRTLVNQRIMANTARKEGIKVYDPEIVLALEAQPPQELIASPTFQTNGQFDPQKYREALANPNNSWAYFEDITRQQLPERKLEERVLSSLKISEPELRDTYHERFDRLTATVVVVPPDTAPVAPPKPADLDRVYNEHKGRFVSGPRVDLEALLVPKKYSDEDVRTARQFAQSLVDRARKGEDFGQLARDYSEGAGASQGGVIDRVLTPAELGPEVAAKLATLAPGQVADPVSANGRFVVLKLIERVQAPGQPQPGYRLAQILVRVRPSDETRQAQYQELEKLRSRAVALKSLGKAAAEKGMGTGRTGLFAIGDTPPGMQGEPEAADWAFGAVKGAVSPVFEGVDDYAIVQVAERLTGGPLPRDLIQQTLTQIAAVEAKVERDKPVADRIAQALAQGRSLEDAAKQVGLTAFTAKDVTRAQPDRRIANAPQLIGAMFAASPGQTIGPVRETAGWCFARVDQKTEAPMDSTYIKARGQLMTQILAARQRGFFTSWVEDLRSKAKVVMAR